MITPETARTMLAALKDLTDTLTTAWPSLIHSVPVFNARAAIKQAEEEIND